MNGPSLDNDVPTETDQITTPCNDASSEHAFLGDHDMEDWVPTIEELENFDSEESDESEYFTDDELGGRVLKAKPKRRALRPLSSDDLDSEDDGTRKRKRGSGSRKSKRYCREQQRNHLDDGDEQLYIMRMRCANNNCILIGTKSDCYY